MYRFLFALITLFLGLALSAGCQTNYNPQLLYDEPNGLFDSGFLREIHVDFEDPNYHEILRTSFFDNPSYRLPATIGIDGLSYDSAGVRYKGNSTFCLPNDANNPKVPFNIDMNYWISGQKLMEYKKVKLANGWTDATFAREFAASIIYRRYLPTPEVNLMKLHVQGEYNGLYVNTESINKQFAKKHFGENDGVLIKCDPIQVFCGENQGSGAPDLNWISGDSTAYYSSYTLKSNHGWQELMNLIYTLNFNFDDIEEQLNVDRVLWAFAVNTAIENLDTYNGYYMHNYYLYQTPDGLFQMIPWDLSESFIGALMGWDVFDPTALYEFDPFYAPVERPLLDKLLSNELYRKQYAAHLRTVIGESLIINDVETQVDALQTLAFQAASDDIHRPFDMNAYSEMVDQAQFVDLWGYGGILSTIEERLSFFEQHPEINLTSPFFGEVSIVNELISVQSSPGSTVDLMATLSEYNSNFEAFPMYDDGTNGDNQANDGVFTSALPYYQFGNLLKFYFRAQNSSTMSLLPARAEYEFYEYEIVTSLSKLTFNQTKELVKIVDVLGREIQEVEGVNLFYLYDDGSVERRIIQGL